MATELNGKALDLEALRQVALDYVEGWYTGDPERIARSFHPDMVKRTPFTIAQTGRTVVRHLSATMMIEMARAGGGRDVPADRQHNEVTVLDAGRDVASVKVVSAEYVDHLHLVRCDGRWQIVNVLWEPRLPEKAS